MAEESDPATPQDPLNDASASGATPPAGDAAHDDPFANAAFEAPADPNGGVDSALLDAQKSIDELLKEANFDPASSGASRGAASSQAASAPLPDTAGFELPNLQQVVQDAAISSIDLLRDVELNVKIELGRSRMLVEDVLKRAEGSVVELDKLAGDPVDVYVNERLVARGEVLVLNDNFCVRVNEIVSGMKEEAR